jgi:hypothetical protein
MIRVCRPGFRAQVCHQFSSNKPCGCEIFTPSFRHSKNSRPLRRGFLLEREKGTCELCSHVPKNKREQIHKEQGLLTRDGLYDFKWVFEKIAMLSGRPINRN